MAKFNLGKAKQEAKQESVLGAGYHRVMITQVAEVGLQRGFNRDDEQKNSIGFSFETAGGLQVAKIMPLSMNSYSNYTKVLSACDEVDELEELEELQGKQLYLEIESNGQYPKITGYYHIDDGMSGQPAISERETEYYSVDAHNPETLKKLHRDLRQAISARVRNKG